MPAGMTATPPRCSAPPRCWPHDHGWSGTVQLVFQPAEEGGGGARSMIADGLFQRFPMERIFGWHNWPGLAAGTIAVHDSAVMAAGARFEIAFDGHAGHAALPHLTRDPMRRRRPLHRRAAVHRRPQHRPAGTAAWSA